MLPEPVPHNLGLVKEPRDLTKAYPIARKGKYSIDNFLLNADDLMRNNYYSCLSESGDSEGKGEARHGQGAQELPAGAVGDRRGRDLLRDQQPEGVATRRDEELQFNHRPAGARHCRGGGSTAALCQTS